MNIIEHTRAIREERMRLIEEAKRVFDDAIEAKRSVTPEEQAEVDRMDARISEIEAEVRTYDQREQRERESATSREAFDRQYGDGAQDRTVADEANALRAWLQGNQSALVGTDWEGKRGLQIDLSRVQQEKRLLRQGASPEEVRALLWDTGSSGSLVPTTLSRSLYEYLEATIAMFRMPTTKITTASGEPLQFPRVAAHAIATQVIAQGTAIGGTDPTFGRMQLDAFKYGELVQLASEVVQDSGIDIIDFVTRDVGRAVGRIIDTALVVGSGSGAPQGVMTAAIVGAAGTAFSGGTLPAGSGTTPVPYEALVDLVYSVNDAYRASGNCAFLMRDATAGQLRKLRDGAGGTVGAVLWQPSLTAGIQGGQPDRLLEYPVYTDPNVASLASNAKIMAFGDFSAYYIRQVGNFVFERSDDYAFNVDEITFRGKWRVDGDVIDVTALNIMKNSVT